MTWGLEGGAGAGGGDWDSSSTEDGDGSVLMDEELVIANEAGVHLGLHRNIGGHQPPVGFDV